MIRNETPLSEVNKIPEAKLKELSGKKYFFGHQSVGFNIIDGLQDIIKENPELQLNFEDSSDFSNYDKFNFLHAQIGTNTKPFSKIDAFSDFIKSGIGNIADFAFLKFCYVDIVSNSDINKIFEYYKTTIKQLQKTYPSITFIHIIVPIEDNKSDLVTKLKNLIKGIIGKPIKEKYLDNIKRAQFKELMVKEYEGKEPLFDLAGIESTYADGRRQYHEKKSFTYYSMLSDYTSDGGHLNEKGRKTVAGQFIIFLSELID